MKFLKVMVYFISTISASIIQGEEPFLDIVPPNSSYPDKQANLREHKGRRHCFRNPDLACKPSRKCCTHVAKKQIWCCPDFSKCGKQPKTCEV